MIAFLEYEHGRASASQHVRNGPFNESFPACQEQTLETRGAPESRGDLSNSSPELSTPPEAGL